MLKKREKALVDKMRKAGLLADGEQLDASFRFMIRPFTTAGTDHIKIASWFEHEAFQLVKSQNFVSFANNVIVFPKILDPSIMIEPDHLTYKKHERAVYVGLNINHASWQTASEAGKVDLISDNVSKSIQEISPEYLSERDQRKLLEIVADTRTRLKSKFLH